MSRRRSRVRLALAALVALAACADGSGVHDRSDYSPENAEDRCAREARARGYEVLDVQGTKRLGAMAIEVLLRVSDGGAARTRRCVFDIDRGEARLL